VNAIGLSEAIGRICGLGQTGHLVLTGPDGIEQAWSFVQGTMVGIRPLTPSNHTHDNLTDRSLTALYVGRNIVETFGSGAISLRYHDDETYAPKAPQVHICGSEIIETGLRLGVGLDECFATLEGMGALRRGRLGNDAQVELQRVDRQIIRGVVEYGSGQRAISALSKAIGLDEARTACRTVTLIHLGCMKAIGKAVERLETLQKRLREQDYFQRLNLSMQADAADVIDARNHALGEYQVGDDPDDDVSVKKSKAAVRRLLDEASSTLSDAMMMGIYKIAIQTGRDFNNADIRQSLVSEYALSAGRRLLDARGYQDAEELLTKALQISGRDPQLYIYAGWAQFLASEKTAEDATASAERVRRALELNRNSDNAHLILGKIYRLAGEKDKALRHLNKAKELNRENNEAWQELRLLNSRQAGPKSAIKLEVGSTEGLAPLLGYALAILALLYSGANLIPGGATVWPILPQGVNAQIQVQDGQLNSAMMDAVRERRKKDMEDDPILSRRIKPEVPVEDQVMGNVESYWVADDMWFWTRRAILLFGGLLGIVLISRKKLTEVGWVGDGAGLAFLGLLYGVVVGFLSPAQMSPTSLWIVLGMSLAHVLAEQIFFFGFVGKGLLQRMDSPAVAIVVTALLYGAHQLTFFSTVNMESMAGLMVGVTQVTAFAGGAYAFLLSRTDGILASTLTHMTVMTVMMVNSIQPVVGG